MYSSHVFLEEYWDQNYEQSEEVKSSPKYLMLAVLIHGQIVDIFEPRVVQKLKISQAK